MKLKHFIRDFCIAVLTCSGFVFLYKKSLKKKSPLVRVLVFHHVADRKWFSNILGMAESEYNVLTPQEFHTKTFDTQKINVLLTFDDGYQSWIDTCLPELEARGMKGLFFINSGLLDSADDGEEVKSYMESRLLISPKVPLTWSGAKRLVQSGHTLGGHTRTHPDLATLSGTALVTEIKQDKECLEKILAVQLKDFAYPFGRRKNWNEEVRAVALESGYTALYTAESGFVDGSDATQIHRVCIENNQSLTSVKHWIEGGYDIFNRIVS